MTRAHRQIAGRTEWHTFCFIIPMSNATQLASDSDD
jgi:hypothetical protein